MQFSFSFASFLLYGNYVIHVRSTFNSKASKGLDTCGAYPQRKIATHQLLIQTHSTDFDISPLILTHVFQTLQILVQIY
jgi:hypothetical protein